MQFKFFLKYNIKKYMACYWLYFKMYSIFICLSFRVKNYIFNNYRHMLPHC